jgi:hypothetical protein
MTLDMRAVPYNQIFQQLKHAIAWSHAHDEDIDVFMDASDFEKCMTIKGFVEYRTNHKTAVLESCGFYVLRIMRDFNRMLQCETDADICNNAAY